MAAELKKHKVWQGFPWVLVFHIWWRMLPLTPIETLWWVHHVLFKILVKYTAICKLVVNLSYCVIYVQVPISKTEQTSYQKNSEICSIYHNYHKLCSKTQSKRHHQSHLKDITNKAIVLLRNQQKQPDSIANEMWRVTHRCLWFLVWFYNKRLYTEVDLCNSDVYQISADCQ